MKYISFLAKKNAFFLQIILCIFFDSQVQDKTRFFEDKKPSFEVDELMLFSIQSKFIPLLKMPFFPRSLKILQKLINRKA
jgi:hypothetical protein